MAVAAATAIPTPAAAAPQLRTADIRASNAPFAPGEAIVRFKTGTTADERRSTRAAARTDFARSLRISRTQLVEVDGSVQAAVRRLERDPNVVYAQPNYRYEATSTNDTFFDSLWGLEDTPPPNPGVNVLAAWETTKGAEQVIAVLDTGVAQDHPDLEPNLWDGGVGGSHGIDLVDGDDDPDDFHFHGTHVAGTAAAVAGNGLGIAGVAPEAEIMAVRVLDGNGSGFTADIALGVKFAVDNGADVINMSLGGSPDADDHLLEAEITAANAANVVVVVAAGNDLSNNDQVPTMPCNLPNTNLICVAAVDQEGDLANFSNYGKTTVDVAAPGTNILSAETDYASVFQDGFEVDADWDKLVANGGVPWGFVSERKTEGAQSAADSPGGDYGNATDPDFYAQSVLRKTAGISLVGERGCRLEFDLQHDLEAGWDYFHAHARTPDVNNDLFWTGSSGGSFFREKVSISEFDGALLVKPRFTVLSDEIFTDDGVYVDDLEVLCRDNTYEPPTANYVAFWGTSMATPHVAGVVALLKAADPSATNAEIVQAVKAGVLQLPSLKCRTVTGGTVDAAAAIAALGSGAAPPNGCPAPPRSGGTTTTTPPPAETEPVEPLPVAPLVKPDLRLAKSRIRVKRSRFAYRFRAAAGLRGRAVFRTRVKALVPTRRGTVRRHLTLARPRFAVGPRGVVRLRVRLTRKQMRILRLNRRLRLRVAVTVRDDTGRTATARKRLVLVAPRIRRR